MKQKQMKKKRENKENGMKAEEEEQEREKLIVVVDWWWCSICEQGYEMWGSCMDQVRTLLADNVILDVSVWEEDDKTEKWNGIELVRKPGVSY